MKSCPFKLAVALVLFVAALPASAQNYPFPGKAGDPPVLCNGCPGENSSGQPNDGLKTWPYSNPQVAYIGRIVDSTNTSSDQLTFRTGRARSIRISRETRGSAPPRAYVQIGSAVAAYSLNSFFTSTLPGGMQTIGQVIHKAVRHSEKVLPWNGFVYPELSSAWNTPLADGQDRMSDFDFDDQGYLYVATGGTFGWGIVKDGGETGGNQFAMNSQVLDDSISPTAIISIKLAGDYYVVTSDGSSGRLVRMVNNRFIPDSPSKYQGAANSVISWAKDNTRQRIAVTTGGGQVSIYTFDDFVHGRFPIETFTARSGKKYKDITVDDDGNFWTTEATTSVASGNYMVKLQRGSAGYTERDYDLYGGPFSPVTTDSQGKHAIEYGDKYLTVVGRVPGTLNHDVRLFKIDGGEPTPVDLHRFFEQYYHQAPVDYAEPGITTNCYGAYVVTWPDSTGKDHTYLIYEAEGLGDVFELETGDTITASQKSGQFGTANPNAKSAEPGPYYADILRFTATSSNPSVQYALDWDFDNIDSGTANADDDHQTGQDVEHQFTGLNTAAKINQVRHVTATAKNDPDINDAVDVTLKLPTARIGLLGTNVAIANDNASMDVVAGDAWTDASDGSVQGHFAAWVIDGGTPTKLLPNATAPVGAVGAHTVALSANYAKYDDQSFVTVGSPYIDSVSNLAYSVRPFVASFLSPTTSGSSATFRGAARVTSLTSVLAAGEWTVDWSLTNPSGGDIVPPTSDTVAVGEIPPFDVADKSSIVSGSTLTLKVSVPVVDLLEGDPSFAEHEISQTLVTPDPNIAKSGCAHVGDPCTFTAGSVGGDPIDGWTIAWTLKKGSTTVATFTGNPFKPTITDAGSYTVSLTATTTVFQGTASLPAFTVEAPVCGDPPTINQGSIYTSCSSCDVGEQVTIRFDPWEYTLTGCEQYSWIFGDGGTATTSSRSTTHAYTSQGSKTIKVTVKKGTESSPQFTTSISVGSAPPPPPPPCTTPSNIQVTYSGSKGCSTGTTCKTGESIKFTALRGSSSLASCDNASWTFGDGGTSTTKSPSKTYNSAGSFNVGVTISNTSGQAAGSITVPVEPDTTSGCAAPPTSQQLYITFSGAQSGCSLNNGTCAANEQITFTPHVFPIDGFQTCDKFEWNFHDGSATSSSKTPAHPFAGSQSSYQVSLRVYNSTDSTGTTVSVNVPFSSAPPKPTPKLTWTTFPLTGLKDAAVTFVVASDIDATGWSWTFGDGTTDNSHAGVTGKSDSISHTYTGTGTFTVEVKARNADDVSSAPTGSASKQIVIDDIPEYRYLLPVVVNGPGQNSSMWQTDVLIYNPDPNVSPSHALDMTAEFKGRQIPLHMTVATYAYEDFMRYLTTGPDAGPVIVSMKTKYPPQIWTRTYNQTENGTFGQYIPAILLDSAGGGSAVSEGTYYLAGLRHGTRYRTNLGFLNPTQQTFNATIRVYDDQRLPLKQFTKELLPFQLLQFPVTQEVPDLPPDVPFSVEIDVPAGQWIIAYGSLVDAVSNDPVYIQAVRDGDLASEDYRNNVIPGVGHIGQWRSDVTIFNPDRQGVQVDLLYYSSSGEKLAEADGIFIGALQFIQYQDLLKQGVLGTPPPDGLGILRVNTTTSAIPNDRYPMTFARTYFDDGANGTYGQGIGGFAAARANVKAGHPALIPGVRSDASRYYTNIGLTNISDSQATVTVTLLDPSSGLGTSQQHYTLDPNQTIVGLFPFPAGVTTASLKVETSGGNIWAFASVIDRQTKDPEYVPASPLP